MFCARSWRMAATVELSTPPLMATATVFAVWVAAAPGVDSSWVSEDNCLVLYICKFDIIRSTGLSNRQHARAGGRSKARSVPKGTGKTGR